MTHYPPLTKNEEKQIKQMQQDYVANVLKEVSVEIEAVIENPKVSLIDIHRKLDEIVKFISPSEYIKLKMQLHKLAHGEKINIAQHSVIEVKGYTTLSPDDFPEPPRKVIEEKKDDVDKS